MRRALIGSRFPRESERRASDTFVTFAPLNSGLSVCRSPPPLPLPPTVTRKQGGALYGPVAEQIVRPNLRGFFPVHPLCSLALSLSRRYLDPVAITSYCERDRWTDRWKEIKRQSRFIALALDNYARARARSFEWYFRLFPRDTCRFAERDFSRRPHREKHNDYHLRPRNGKVK